MTPEKTNFITQGYDGIKRLKQGPMLDSYRGLNIIHSRQYSLETGAPPRDLLRRRVRVAEYYRIPWQQAMGENNGDSVMIDLYDESRDTTFSISWNDLLNHAALDDADKIRFANLGNTTTVGSVSAFAGALGHTMLYQQRIPGDYIAVVRNIDLNQAVGQLGGAFGFNQAMVATPNQPGADLGTGLVLISNKKKFENNLIATSRLEYQSFYAGSGWFNGVTQGGNRNSQYTFRHTFTKWQLPAIAAGNEDDRKAQFKMLAYGRKIPGFVLSPRVKSGFRPNLHIGR